MRLPYSWLRQYVDVKLAPEKLARALTLSGTKVESVARHGDDTVIHIEVTTNRPDCLSITGLARETAALSGKRIQFPKIGPVASKGEALRVRVEDKKGCPRYTARLIRGVSVKPAAPVVQKWLDAVGTRAINNVVDATNFVLFETGQPLHAFDFDKLAGGGIIVRRALKGEKFLAIDGSTYELDAETLVIADREKPVAIAGVMGGKLTEVTESTKNVLLESAYFEPVTVRRASKRYKLTTESSYRFERGVDPGAVAPASARARDLILEAAGGRETGGFLDANFLPKSKPRRIALDVLRVNRRLGLSVSAPRVVSILKSLNIPAAASGKNRVVANAPDFRRDLLEEIDIAEEILRVEGFDKVTAKLPERHAYFEVPPQTKKKEALPELKKRLALMGFWEAITYSFVSEKMLVDCGERPERCFKVKNPVSADWTHLRPSFLPGLLQCARYNVHRKADRLSFFEIGKRFVKGEDPEEQTALAVLLYGPLENNWMRKSASSFYDVKGAIENAIRFLGAREFEWRPLTDDRRFDGAATLLLGGKPVGMAGSVSARSLERWDIPHEVFFAECSLEWVPSQKPITPQAQPLPKFPAVRRDIAFVIDEKFSVKTIAESIIKTGSPYLKEAELFDQYIGKNIARGKRSLAFSLCYRKETGTFTDEEIRLIHERVGQALKSEYKVELR